MCLIDIIYSQVIHMHPNATGQADVTLISSKNLSKLKSAKTEDLFHSLINLMLDESKLGCSTAILLDRPPGDRGFPLSGLVPRVSGT
jgi:hypothetical protein